jgi:hypothetical protein
MKASVEHAERRAQDNSAEAKVRRRHAASAMQLLTIKRRCRWGRLGDDRRQ